MGSTISRLPLSVLRRKRTRDEDAVDNNGGGKDKTNGIAKLRVRSGWRGHILASVRGNLEKRDVDSNGVGSFFVRCKVRISYSMLPSAHDFSLFSLTDNESVRRHSQNKSKWRHQGILSQQNQVGYLQKSTQKRHRRCTTDTIFCCIAQFKLGVQLYIFCGAVLDELTADWWTGIRTQRNIAWSKT